MVSIPMVSRTVSFPLCPRLALDALALTFWLYTAIDDSRRVDRKLTVSLQYYVNIDVPTVFNASRKAS
uniref:Secreted protein n=1 Tax=Steinernema glaseri TaxID=37863 RepID=A0A1I8A4B0_9BILA